MKTIGIIAEYNPFHNGHKYHIEASKNITGEDSRIIACMSGNFVQRGGPAVFDKWTRAELAVKSGVDLVIELPFISASSSAEHFAEGGVRLLDSLGVVDFMSFGSESGEIEKLRTVSAFLANESEEFKTELKSNLDEGISFPAARHRAVEKCLGKEFSDTVSAPNDTLAVEYLKQLTLRKSSMKPLAVVRCGEDHNKRSGPVSGRFASAAHIRNILKAGEDFWWYVPWKTGATPFSSASLKSKPVFTDSMYRLASAELLRIDAKDLADIVSVREGFENRLKEKVRYAGDWEELMNLLKAKRFTRTAIQRMIAHILMNLTREKYEKAVSNSTYARVLAFNRKGASLIKEIKNNNPDARIITNINKDVSENDDIYASVELDIRATDIYNILAGNNLYAESDFVKKPFVL